MTDARAKKTPGRILAEFLSGSWRAHPPEPTISSQQLDAITPLLLKSGAGALAWRCVRDSALNGSEIALQLESSHKLHTLQAAIHKTDIEEVILLLNSAGIEPVLVKGWAVARLYPEEGLRPYGDIDLCFAPGQYPEASSLLKSLDPVRYNLDLHEGFTKLDGLGLDELMARSETARLGDAKFRVLGAEDQLRILCAHLLRHGAWRPLWLCDIGAAVESRPASFDWERCLGTNALEADWVACAIGLAHQLLNARVDDTAVAQRASRLPQWLVRDVIKNWNHPFPEHFPPLSYVPPMAAYFGHPRGALTALRRRWPDPIEATIRLRGPFNEMPRLPFQIGNAVQRVVRFLTRTQ